MVAKSQVRRGRMATRMRQLTIGLVGGAALLAATTVPAMAWYGATTITVYDYSNYGGWVDGNGPDNYTFGADCNDGQVQTGVTRWAGDRNGSVASCDDHGGIIPGSGHRFIILSQ